MGFKIFFWIFFAPCLLFGFRVLPGFETWNIDRSSTTNSKLFVVYDNPTTVLTNDLPSEDPLGASSTVTIQQIINSILSDYNNIAGAYVTLVDSNDADFAARGATRTITIRDGAAIGATSGGYARPTMVDGKMTGCEIVLNPDFFRSPEKLTRGVTHEMGHCLGLNHAMDTTNAVMSYYYTSRPTIRLQIDDKMGLVYLYPVNPSSAKEQATLGLACSRSQ